MESSQASWNNRSFYHSFCQAPDGSGLCSDETLKELTAGRYLHSLHSWATTLFLRGSGSRVSTSATFQSNDNVIFKFNWKVPGSLVVRMPSLHLLRTWVQFLIRDLTAHKLWDANKRKQSSTGRKSKQEEPIHFWKRKIRNRICSVRYWNIFEKPQ